MTQIPNQVNVSESPFQAQEITLQKIYNNNADAPTLIQTDSCKQDSCSVLQSNYYVFYTPLCNLKSVLLCFHLETRNIKPQNETVNIL